MTLPNRVATRDRLLADSEIKAVWNAAEAFGFPFGTIIQLCILTGQRRSEIARLRWDCLDLDAKIVTLPPEETKNSRQHKFLLAAMVAAIIEKLDHSSPYLFLARREFRTGTPAFVYNAWSKDKHNLDLTCAIPRWTLHDLRRTSRPTWQHSTRARTFSKDCSTIPPARFPASPRFTIASNTSPRCALR